MVTIEKKTIKVGKLVDTKYVDTLIRNYKQERWLSNSKHIGKEDSLSVWFSLAELEAFFTTVKEHGGDGIKMHFGVYDDDFNDNPLYAGRQTIVMIATKTKETEDGPINKNIYINNEKSSSILAYNFGLSCPPTCPPDKGSDVGITILDKGSDGMVVT